MPNRRSVSLTDQARADLQRLAEDDARLAVRARALLELIAAGRITGVPLKLMPSYGDLRDCSKVYFAATGQGSATHRIVYRSIDGKDGPATPIEVVEVVAIEAREDGYAYLLASHRLGRIPPEVKKRSRRVHERMIAERSARRKKQ